MWQHPKNDLGRFIPKYDGDYATAARQWMDDAIAWDQGDDPAKAEHPFFWEWEGSPPEPDDYMPSWTDEEKTHLMMYETTSEGTPISPAFATPEELARWLADTGASAFGGETATYEQWLNTCRGAWAPSLVMIGGKLMSGVEFSATSPQPDM